MLPFLKIQSHIKTDHKVPHCMDYYNGFRVYPNPKRQINGEIINSDAVGNLNQNNEHLLFDPLLTYGTLKKPNVKPFLPDFVVNNNVILSFDGFYRRHNYDENQSTFDHICYVKILYFMEDDTITILGPSVHDCTTSRSRIVRRSKILKNHENNLYYSWKDFNIGIDLYVFGIKYHITDCDHFTRDFLISRGIELNTIEVQPKNREFECTQKNNESKDTQQKLLKTFNNIENVILTFDCIRLEDGKHLSNCIPYKLFYFTEDETIAMKVLKNENDEKKFSMFLRRCKATKTSQCSKLIDTNDDSTDNIIINPFDMKIGNEIEILGYRFLLIDCDQRTQQFYANVLKSPQNDKILIEKEKSKEQNIEIPIDCLGIGAPEDSLENCFNIVPRTPRKNVINALLNANKLLRYKCILDSKNPFDQNREFILKYSLGDGKISIVELLRENSGFQGGKFLSSQLIVKPNSNPKIPEYYSPVDFKIGSVLTINSRRFKIIDADAAVSQYINEHHELFADVTN